MAKLGRPKKPDAKKGSVHFRIGEKETEMLRELSKRNEKTRTDIFVGLLEREYERVVGKKEE